MQPRANDRCRVLLPTTADGLTNMCCSMPGPRAKIASVALRLLNNVFASFAWLDLAKKMNLNRPQKQSLPTGPPCSGRASYRATAAGIAPPIPYRMTDHIEKNCSI